MTKPLVWRSAIPSAGRHRTWRLSEGKDGSEGDRCVKTKDFCERVKRRFPKAEVLLWDERFSTIAAERSLREVGLNHNQRKSVIDKMAAVHILQGYLDSKARG